MTKTFPPSDAQQQVAESLPELEARMRAQFAAYHGTMTKVLELRAAEPPAPYGKKKRRAGASRGLVYPSSTSTTKAQPGANNIASLEKPQDAGGGA